MWTVPSWWHVWEDCGTFRRWRTAEEAGHWGRTFRSGPNLLITVCFLMADAVWLVGSWSYHHAFPTRWTTSPTLKPRINSFLPETAFPQHPVTVVRKLSSLLVSGSPDVLDNGVSVCDVPEHHALDDAVVLLFWEVLVGHEGDVVLGGWWGVYSLEPRVALNLFQRGSPFRVSLQHPCDQAAKEGSPLLKQTLQELVMMDVTNKHCFLHSHKHFWVHWQMSIWCHHICKAKQSQPAGVLWADTGDVSLCPITSQPVHSRQHCPARPTGVSDSPDEGNAMWQLFRNILTKN